MTRAHETMAKMNSRLLDTLDAWDLLDADFRADRYNLREWKRIAEAIEGASLETPLPAIGSVHLGLTDGIAIGEGRLPLSALGMAAVMFERVWLPDPLFGFFSQTSAEAWRLLPDSGSKWLTGRGSIRASIESFWSVPIDQRRVVLRKTLPKILEQLKKLRPLLESGAIALIPWEPSFVENADELHRLAGALSMSPLVTSVTQRHRQIQYSLGPRIGAIGIEVSGPSSDSKLKAGDPMYWVEKRPMILLGLLNASLSQDTGASFLPTLPGDRDVYDFVRAGGVEQAPQALGEPLKMPKLSQAAWDDVVAIRGNSQALGELRTVIRDVAGITEATLLPAIADRLNFAATRLKEEASIWKTVKNSAIDAVVGTAIGAAGSITSAGKFDPAAAGAVGAGVATFLLSLSRARESRKRREKTQAAEILVNFLDRLTP